MNLQAPFAFDATKWLILNTLFFNFHRYSSHEIVYFQKENTVFSLECNSIEVIFMLCDHKNISAGKREI